jgi:hypothetical protein
MFEILIGLLGISLRDRLRRRRRSRTLGWGLAVEPGRPLVFSTDCAHVRVYEQLQRDYRPFLCREQGKIANSKRFRIIPTMRDASIGLTLTCYVRLAIGGLGQVSHSRERRTIALCLLKFSAPERNVNASPSFLFFRASCRQKRRILRFSSLGNEARKRTGFDERAHAADDVGMHMDVELNLHGAAAKQKAFSAS